MPRITGLDSFSLSRKDEYANDQNAPAAFPSSSSKTSIFNRNTSFASAMIAALSCSEKESALSSLYLRNRRKGEQRADKMREDTKEEALPARCLPIFYEIFDVRNVLEGVEADPPTRLQRQRLCGHARHHLPPKKIAQVACVLVRDEEVRAL